MTESPAPARVSTGAAFLWILLYGVLTNVAVIGISHLAGSQRHGLAMFGLWILQLIVILGLAAWISKKTGGRGWLFVQVIAFAVVALVYGVALGHIPRLFNLRETPPIPVRDADQPAYEDCEVFHFTDGHVDLDHVERRRIVSRGGSVTYLVAPIVPEGWRPSDPIPAWVGNSVLDRTVPPDWHEPRRGGYRIGLDSTYGEIIESYVRNARLRSAASAPILNWSSDPAGEFRRVGYLELSLFLAIDALGLVSVLFTRSRP